MTKTLSSVWVRYFRVLLVSALISFNQLPAWSNTSQIKTAQSERIANKILELQESEQRWIQIDLANQRLIAWEGTKPVYAVIVSTGKRATPTVLGTFAIQTKHRVTRMTGPGYDVPDVPHTMYFHRGYAIHGAYWHNRFGTPVSHGCINVAPDHASWLFNWATVGTPVVVHE
jgi:lipoprotein-anchoring transpeptidase ErfK/SrfK